jgi:protein gp37
MGTRISWTTETWNPTTGCSRVSDGCRYCYAEALSLRRGWSSKPWTANHAAKNLVLHHDRLRKPYTWKTPRRVFVDSMSDIFHEQVPDEFISQVFAVMADLPRHTFQILTKRPQRAAAWAGPWARNIWMGTSVEDRRVLHRVDELRACAAQLRFLSCEPLLGDLGPLDLRGIGWVIVGGESGSHIGRHPERVMDHAWARAIRDQCGAAGIPFWFKQSSGVRTEMGSELIEEDGTRTQWRQFPESTQRPLDAVQATGPASPLMVSAREKQ